MLTSLAQAIGEAVDAAIHAQDGRSAFRGDVLGEEWKIIVDYDGTDERLTFKVMRRDNGIG